MAMRNAALCTENKVLPVSTCMHTSNNRQETGHGTHIYMVILPLINKDFIHTYLEEEEDLGRDFGHELQME
jgi:hypothetical protein